MSRCLRALGVAALLFLPLLPAAAAPAPTATFQAEDFPTRTTGARESSSQASNGAYWNIWSNGHVERSVSFASPATAEVQVLARGTSLAGIPARMVVTLDGATVIDRPVTAAFAWYASAAQSIAAGSHAVRIRFTNDAVSSTEDRNLHADAMRFGAATAPPPPAATGAKEAEAFAIKTAGGRQALAAASGGAYWNLWSNGHLQDTLRGEPGVNLSIVARGTPLDGVWPAMVVSVDGVVTGRFTVATSAFQAFLAPPLPAGAHTVRIAFTNDAMAGSEDRNLLLDVVRSAAGANPATFTLAPGKALNVTFAWGGGDGFVLAHARTPATGNSGAHLEVTIDGNVSKVAPVPGPTTRPVLAPLGGPNGTHTARFRALGGTVVVEDWAAQPGPRRRTSPARRPASTTAGRRPTTVGGSRTSAAWRRTWWCRRAAGTRCACGASPPSARSARWSTSGSTAPWSPRPPKAPASTSAPASSSTPAWATPWVRPSRTPPGAARRGSTSWGSARLPPQGRSRGPRPSTPTPTPTDGRSTGATRGTRAPTPTPPSPTRPTPAAWTCAGGPSSTAA